MAKTEKTLKSSKKVFREEVAGKLKDSFGELADILGQRKFEKRIRRASKILAGNLRGRGEATAHKTSQELTKP